MKLPQLDNQEKKELSMVEVAVAVLEATGDVMYFEDLLNKVAEYLEMSDEEVEEQMARFYTDINTRGTFISPIDGMWGLREWYPIDAINEELTFKNDEDNVHTKIANDGFDEIVDEEELEDEIEDEAFVEADPEDDLDDEDDNDELNEYEEDLEELAIDDDQEDEDELEDLTIIDEDELDD